MRINDIRGEFISATLKELEQTQVFEYQDGIFFLTAEREETYFLAVNLYSGLVHKLSGDIEVNISFKAELRIEN